MKDAGQTLSKAAFARLTTELEHLRTDGRRDVAARLQRARELGDLSENAEYHATKEEQGLMEARISQLEHLLRTAEIVDAPAAADHAQPGTIVTLRDTDDADGEPERYLLAASTHERAEGLRTVTTGSPLGKALDGAYPGDTVKYEAPGGVFTYEVVAVEPWDGA